MKRILNIIIIILLSAICLTGTAQKIAVKSNLLGWATATPTLGAEIGLDDRWTLNTHIYYNPFTFRDNRKWKHIRVQPEVRYWLCQKFNGHFFGLHVLYTHFNAGQVPLPFGIFPDVKKYRYQGNTYGAGLSYGYQWILTPRWSIEGSIGVGYKYNTLIFCHRQYAALVQKPPNVTNRITGLRANKSDAPNANAVCCTSAPASSPRLKQALIIPASKATEIPLVKAKSRIAFCFSSSLIFRAFKLPA